MHATGTAVLAPQPASSTIPEAIYARLFREMKPRTPLPEIQVQFRRYANAKAQIRLQPGILLVRIADTLAAAPEDIHEALAEILLSKLFRRPIAATTNERYRRYLNRGDVRSNLDRVRSARGRKLVENPKGTHYDLLEIFDELNFQYFFGLMARPTLGWSRQASHTLLGHYDSSHNTIVLSRVLDRAEVPRLAVEYVLYHEMLHVLHPVEHRGARRCVHTPAFKAEEKKFARFREAKALLKHLS
jgi:hypothetical protein